MRRRWRVEVKLDGEWREKRFYTKTGATIFMTCIKWAADRYAIALYREPRKP